MDRSAARLVLDGITVDFGATRALNEISFQVAPGEIVGLLGHNGAGKSTLLNVITGVVGATGGSFSVDGKSIKGRITPRESAELDITVLHQEPALVPNLTILENLFLVRTAPSATKQRQVAHEALALVGVHLPLDMPVESLSLAERQLVDLTRGLLGGDMKVLLLDEPTAALDKAGTDSLHALIRRFADHGTAILYVSHRLPDIIEVCSRIVVLRGGDLVVDGATAGFTAAKLAEALVPDIRSLDFVHVSPGDVRFEAEISEGKLRARSGEVVGLFGMAGGRQFDIAASISGAKGSLPTRYQLSGRTVQFSSTKKAIKHGVFYVPPDREIEGLVASQTALDNVLLPWYAESSSRGWWVSSKTGMETYGHARQSLDIRGPESNAEMSQFSGGNRQKHLLARWLYPKLPSLLVLSQPTQGVDVGAKLDIVEGVRDVSASGASVLVASSESDEIASMCDRAYVIHGSSIVEVRRSQYFNEDLLDALLSIGDAARM